MNLFYKILFMKLMIKICSTLKAILFINMKPTLKIYDNSQGTY